MGVCAVRGVLLNIVNQLQLIQTGAENNQTEVILAAITGIELLLAQLKWWMNVS